MFRWIGGLSRVERFMVIFFYEVRCFFSVRIGLWVDRGFGGFWDLEGLLG